MTQRMHPEEIRQHFTEMGWSIEKGGYRFGCGPSHMRKIMAGSRPLPSDAAAWLRDPHRSHDHTPQIRFWEREPA